MNDSDYNNLCAHANELMHTLRDRMLMRDAWIQEVVPGMTKDDFRWNGPAGDDFYVEAELAFQVNILQEKLDDARADVRLNLGG